MDLSGLSVSIQSSLSCTEGSDESRSLTVDIDVQSCLVSLAGRELATGYGHVPRGVQDPMTWCPR